jgi:hypothetical protein
MAAMAATFWSRKGKTAMASHPAKLSMNRPFNGLKNGHFFLLQKKKKSILKPPAKE